MTLSVVIPAHGREELLARCVASLAPSNQGGLEAEICVVDDGSSLIWEGIMRAAGGMTVVRRGFESPRGRSAARNEGVRATTGEIVVFLDSDMEAEPGFLAGHLDAHRKNSRTAVIGRILWPRGGGFLRYIGSRGVAKLRPGDDVPPWYFVTGNASVRRGDIPEPFDETIPGWGGEDQAFGLSLAGAGVGFGYAPDAVSRHHFSGTLADHLDRTFSYGRGSIPLMVRNHPEFRRVLRLDLLESLPWRMAVSGAAYHPAAAFARAFDRLPLPAALYDYLTFAAYARGWLASGAASPPGVNGGTERKADA